MILTSCDDDCGDYDGEFYIFQIVDNQGNDYLLNNEEYDKNFKFLKLSFYDQPFGNGGFDFCEINNDHLIGYDMLFPTAFKVDYGNGDIDTVTTSYRTEKIGCFDIVNSFEFCLNDSFCASYNAEDVRRLKRNASVEFYCENEDIDEPSLIIQLVKYD
jgi:hypothetical protein